MTTINKFYKEVEITQSKYPSLRKGQIYFNVAFDMYHGSVGRLAGDETYDCFYDDSKIDNFIYKVFGEQDIPNE